MLYFFLFAKNIMINLKINNTKCIHCMQCLDVAAKNIACENGNIFVSSNPCDINELDDCRRAIDACPADAISFDFN